MKLRDLIKQKITDKIFTSNIDKNDLAEVLTTIKPYDVYLVRISQTGTSDPVVNKTIENTIGTITFDYFTEESPGSYKVLSDGLFDENTQVMDFFGMDGSKGTFEYVDENQINIYMSDDNLLTQTLFEIRNY